METRKLVALATLVAIPALNVSATRLTAKHAGLNAAMNGSSMQWQEMLGLSNWQKWLGELACCVAGGCEVPGGVIICEIAGEC